jgi:hypothetical protein
LIFETQKVTTSNIFVLFPMFEFLCMPKAHHFHVPPTHKYHKYQWFFLPRFFLSPAAILKSANVPVLCSRDSREGSPEMDPSRRPRYCSPEICSNTWRNQKEETKVKIVDKGGERRVVGKATNGVLDSGDQCFLLFEHVTFLENKNSFSGQYWQNNK